MVREGQIVLFAFPQTDMERGRLRPALVLRAIPGAHDDWLICMISSQLHQLVPGLDEVISDADESFAATGLRRKSLVRVSRLAVVSKSILIGTIGKLDDARMTRIRARLAQWISEG